MVEKTLSPEEKAKQEAAAKLYEDRKSRLKSFMVYSAAKTLSGEGNPFGEMGTQAGKMTYSQFMTSKIADDSRKELYQEKLEEAEGLGTVSQPDYPTNYELERTAIGLLGDSFNNLKLGDLEKIVKGINKECTLKVPEEFKDFSMAKIQKKIMEAKAKGEKYAPSEKEEAQVQTLKMLEQAYYLGTAFNAVRESYMSGVNHFGEVLNEKYKPKAD